MQLGGKLRYACDPWSILARPEPPGRLHTSTGTPYEEIAPLARHNISRRLYRITPGPFQLRIERPFLNTRYPELNPEPSI